LAPWYFRTSFCEGKGFTGGEGTRKEGIKGFHIRAIKNIY
jgi:hypothetical protein